MNLKLVFHLIKYQPFSLLYICTWSAVQLSASRIFTVLIYLFIYDALGMRRVKRQGCACGLIKVELLVERIIIGCPRIYASAHPRRRIAPEFFFYDDRSRCG